MEFAGEFKKEWDCLEALQEMGCCVGNIGNTESEISLHKMWMQNFCKMHPKKAEMDSKIELKYAVEHFCDIIINRADLYFMNL